MLHLKTCQVNQELHPKFDSVGSLISQDQHPVKQYAYLNGRLKEKGEY